jgi:hypothetical protein
LKIAPFRAVAPPPRPASPLSAQLRFGFSIFFPKSFVARKPSFFSLAALG